MTEMSVEKLITKARINILLQNPFFGFLALHLEPKETEEIPTMGTNGLSLSYNPKYVLKLASDPSMKCVETAILHELYHIAFGHLWRRGTRDAARWNIAADAVVNEDLAQRGRYIPPDWVRIEGVKDKSVEEVYRNIQVVEIPVDGDGAEADSEERTSKGEKNSGNGDRGKTSFKTNDGSRSSGRVEQDHSQWGKDNNGKKMTEAEQKNLAESWKARVSQARQLAKQQGQGLGHFEELIDELLEPKLNWIEFIKNFVLSAAKTDYRIVPPSKRYMHMGIFMPSLYGEKFEIGFAIDTSGSMSTEDIIKGLSEVKGVCELFADWVIHLYQADYGVQEYKQLTPLDFDFPKQIRGRGGTSFVPVFDDIAKNGIEISCLIYFTDLMGDFPQVAPPYPVLWLATNNRQAPFGVTVKYEKEDGEHR